MKLMAVRRVQMASSGKSEVPLPPAPPPHPGYAPNAALHAIKRHAAEFAAPKAQAVSKSTLRQRNRPSTNDLSFIFFQMGDEKEGPVTKSIQ